MADYKYTAVKFVRDWAVVIAMIVGILSYFAYKAMPSLYIIGPTAVSVVKFIQPILIFTMLFISFSKIEPSHMRPHRWMIWLLCFQTLSFIALALALVFFPNMPFRIGVEAAMLCMICPTAAACAVITGKLGGNIAGVMSYTILINLAAAILIPIFTPLIHPSEQHSFLEAFSQILGKVFPLLIMPCLLAWIVRYLFPVFHAKVVEHSNLSFYLYLVSLTLAILMSVRAMVGQGASGLAIGEITLAALVTCALQFYFGRRVGRRYKCSISSAQSIGQKNTVFAIWVGYTFLTPVISMAGGIYSVFQNTFNSWQLYRKRKPLR